MIEYNEENLARMLNAADTLLGTCKCLEDVLESEFGEEGADLLNFDTELLRELDDATMMCEACNWWCEPGELDDDQICNDCRIPSDDD